MRAKRIITWLASCAAFALSAFFPTKAVAATVGGDAGPTSVEVHGFASQGFILTLKNDYLAERSTRGSFEYSEFGINFTTHLTDTVRTGAQLFAQDLGPSGNYDVKLDWFYIDYRWKDWLGIRAGRLKIPYGLYNEIQDVDAARVPVLLPQSVYPLQGRETLFAQTGGELYGFIRSDSLGALDYRLFGGTIFLDSRSLTPRGAGFELDFHVPYVVGGRLLWETPLEGFRLGGTIEDVRLDTTVLIPGMASFKIKNHSLGWVGSAELSRGDLVLTAEYARWHSTQSSDAPALSPPLDRTSERAYIMASYRLTPWFQPGAYYSVLFPNVDNRKGRENRQHDVAATLRFDINPYWLVKVEGHYMAGTAGLLNPISINPPDITKADKYWGAFFLKTTAHF
ncbi:MAG TPA: hypothetical protein VHB79_25060 [Polyangiaceae bacterium]|nr:hypothetical protein [Polyangiaceae bacterium]